MPFPAGTRIGPYEIRSLLGAGGMGEVYRARDTILNREVAIKVLPHALSAHPERVARLAREAQTLASLSHPNIGAIFGFESSQGMQALVLELVDGPTLAELIAQGGLTVEQALGIAQQIAKALEAAHAQGVIHRDLKPANVKVREDGTVKVLDFGLAKALDTADSGDPAAQTLTSPALLTAAGVVLGTSAYMAPEQAKGLPADKRSDIWAFGCVCYEMLTGPRATTTSRPTVAS
jgi:serine/threonine protein kinase